MGLLRLTVKKALVSLPSTTVMSLMERVGESSLVMVPVAVAVVMVAPLLGLVRVTVKVSLGSGVVSPLTGTLMAWEVMLAPKVTVPEGKTLPTKSAALAGLVPVPVTAQLTVWVVVVSPVRVTVKVKYFVPELPWFGWHWWRRG